VGESAAKDLRSRRAELESRLDSAKAVNELDALKLDIGTLFKTVDEEIAELTELRAGVLRLVDRWKALKAAPVPHPVPAVPEPSAPATGLQADHLGASTYVEKGWSKISRSDFVGAEQDLRKALELAPDDTHAHSLLGWSQMLQDKLDDALLNFQKVLVTEPQNALARINLGYICLKKGIFGEAIEHLSRAIRLDNDKKATLYAHFYLGLVYLERDMYEDAQTFFQKTLALGPNLIEAYFELGRAYWRNGQRVEAIDTWQAGAAANRFNSWGKRCAEVVKVVEAGGQP
jgi:tetratricopeptide (TPR) repeat protein